MPKNMKTEQQERRMHSASIFRKLISLRALVAAALVAGASSAACADELVGWAHPAVQGAFARDPGHGINKYEIAVNFNTPIQYGNPEGWLFRLQAEANLGFWDSRSGTNRQNLTEFGLTPIFRVEKRGAYFVPYLEAGVGLRLLTHTSTSDQHNFSTAFQFGDMVGLGVGFGKNAATEVGFRFQHISNAGIKEPNPGTNLYTGYVRYRF